MGSSTTHLCVNIDGLLRRRITKGLITRDDGSECSGREGRAWLLEQKALGRRVLPFGDPCDGFDYQTGCPGHPVVEMPGDPFDNAQGAPAQKEGDAHGA